MKRRYCNDRSIYDPKAVSGGIARHPDRTKVVWAQSKKKRAHHAGEPHTIPFDHLRPAGGIPITLARLLLHTGGGSTPSLGGSEELTFIFYNVDTSKNGVLGEYRGEFYSRLSGQAS